MNLLKETQGVLVANNKSMDDVVWVGSRDGYITLETFVDLANSEYSSGFGAQEVASDLIIVGENWWMTRIEYDGSERWDFHSMEHLQKPKNEMKARRVMGGMWDDLATLNEIGEIEF